MQQISEMSLLSNCINEITTIVIMIDLYMFQFLIYVE